MVERTVGWLHSGSRKGTGCRSGVWLGWALFPSLLCSQDKAAEVRGWGGAGEALLRGGVEVLGCFRSLFNLREVE